MRKKRLEHESSIPESAETLKSEIARLRKALEYSELHTLSALEQAIKQAEGLDLSSLIHHSDRGSQYCCNQYIERLKEVGARISMTEDGNPTDNAIAERINGIIKQEWLYKMKRPRNIEQERLLIERIVEFYNNKRPHMANGMKTPAQIRELYNSLFGGCAPPAAQANLSGVFHSI